MGQKIDLFSTSNIGDINRQRDPKVGMGKKANWSLKVSRVGYEKLEDNIAGVQGANNATGTRGHSPGTDPGSGGGGGGAQ